MMGVSVDMLKKMANVTQSVQDQRSMTVEYVIQAVGIDLTNPIHVRIHVILHGLLIIIKHVKNVTLNVQIARIIQILHQHVVV